MKLAGSRLAARVGESESVSEFVGGLRGQRAAIRSRSSLTLAAFRWSLTLAAFRWSLPLMLPLTRTLAGVRFLEIFRRPCLAGLILFAVLATSCAGIFSGGRVLDPTSQTGRAWQALLDGKSEEAAARFTQALAPGDTPEPTALFGAGSLAFERGDARAAAARYLDLIAAADSSGRAFDGLLAEAAAARLSRILDELPERHAVEERIIALSRERLPWRAQYLLANLVADIARQRADAELLEKESRSGCPDELRLTGVAGRLPYLDLLSERVRPTLPARKLQRSGCRFTTPVMDPLPGVRVLRAEFERMGPTWIVLDAVGPALLRVDGGAWHHHGDLPDKMGPRWSAVRIDLAAGRHQLEIRLGTYGGSLDLGLLLAPAVGNDFMPQVRSGRFLLDEAAFEFASALSAHAAGETERELEHAVALAKHRRFSLGLAAAARMAEFDPTRPMEMDRDRARELTLRAVTADPHLARAWLDLSRLELDGDRPREASEHARQARAAAPDWWPPALQLADTLRARGLESEADLALAAALALAEKGQGACSVMERAFRRAEERAAVAEEMRLVEQLYRCDAQSDIPVLWHRQRGDRAAAEAALRRSLRTSVEPSRVRSDLAALRLERGDAAGAVAELQALVDWSPRDSHLRLRLADAWLASGNAKQAKAVLAQALGTSAGNGAVRQAARLLGLPLPLDEFRLDGGQVIRDFLASGHSYAAPAVVVLDRAVDRIFPDGARANLTHTITLVLSKEGIERAGEISVPSGAEILVLRTRKPDGTIREAQEIAGKPTISASDLAVGDFVEWETMEFKPPAEAFAPGFLGDRFYFQSAEAPLHRSEYLLVVPNDMPVDQDRRAGAPEPTVGHGPDGTRVLRFVGQQMPQIFPERSSVSSQDWVPSIRVSSGVDMVHWSRFLADRLYPITRASPELRQVAAQIKADAGGAAKLPETIVGWVNQQIEPEASLFESATSTLARSRGNRGALVIALARALGVRAEWMFVRSLSRSPSSAPAVPQELDDFSDALVRLAGADGSVRFFDPRMRRAPFGYLPPGLAGAPGFLMGDDDLSTTRSSVPDGRHVVMKIQLGLDGRATITVTEDLSGWPVVEWNEVQEQVGRDRNKLRQEFEQRWLSQHFPGAVLDELSLQDTPEGGKQVRYTLTSARLATRTGDTLWLRPSFFLSQPGRRYFTEAKRRTPLQLGFEVPILLEVDMEMPAGAQVIDLGASGSLDAAEAHFSEERMVKAESSATDGPGPVHLLLRRRWHLPLARVLPANYDDIASKLRQVDSLESGEIRVDVGQVR